MNIKIPEHIRGSSPVFVFSPTARNGITLIQRLLNSSHKIVVYGESPDVIDISQVVYRRMQETMMHWRTRAQAREKFRSGMTEFWSSNLGPDDVQLLQVQVDNFSRIIGFYQQWSKEFGYNRWGLKQPLPNLIPLDLLHQFLGNARFVYMYRNLFDVARSSKARTWLKTEEDFAELARRWQDNLLPMIDSPRERVLMIKYEDLVADPGTHIKRLEEFTGITGIDNKVMERKINTFDEIIENGKSPIQYIEPKELTDQESSIIYEHAAQCLEKTGYRDK